MARMKDMLSKGVGGGPGPGLILPKPKPKPKRKPAVPTPLAANSKEQVDGGKDENSPVSPDHHMV